MLREAGCAVWTDRGASCDHFGASRFGQAERLSTVRGAAEHEVVRVAVSTGRVSEEHRERLGWDVESLAMFWQVCLDHFEEVLVGDQVECPDSVERADAPGVLVCLHSGWFRLRSCVATRTYVSDGYRPVLRNPVVQGTG